jgi:hypothetical protein
MKITRAVPVMFAALSALTMKTIITSNWRPLHRALCTLLLCIAALWAMPRNACAQLYVSESGNNTVGEYNATTGAPINANLITGLSEPAGIALSGNNLFVVNGVTTVVTPGQANLCSVGEYDATTGAAINANLITVGSPWGIALSGNNLFVPSIAGGTVGEYNATTGATINPTFITVRIPAFPNVLAVSGNTLFVANVIGNNFAVSVYNATTGAVIKANFITGLTAFLGFAVVPGAATPTPPAATGPVITNFLSYSGDFNADGKQDILWRNLQSGEVRIWYMNGSTILANDGVATVGLDWQIVGIGDFDGSGFSDIVWENANNGSFAIWTMRGDSAVSHQYPSPGYQWSITGIADLDHTGLADLLWRNVVTATSRCG